MSEFIHSLHTMYSLHSLYTGLSQTIGTGTRYPLFTVNSLKNQIWMKTGGVCAKCGKAVESDKGTIDHFIPKYHGGTDDIRNLIPMCRACNRAKSSRLMSIEECCPYLLDEYKEELGRL